MSSSNFRTERSYSNYFEIEYTEPNTNHIRLEVVFIDDYDKKVTYLIKRFPYPELVKNILDKLKFSHYQEKVFLEILSDTINGSFEEHELKCLVRDLNNFTSNSNYVKSFLGRFNGRTATIHYRLKNYSIFPPPMKAAHFIANESNSSSDND